MGVNRVASPRRRLAAAVPSQVFAMFAPLPPERKPRRLWPFVTPIGGFGQVILTLFSVKQQ
jgi:hypothetical protein